MTAQRLGTAEPRIVPVYGPSLAVAAALKNTLRQKFAGYTAPDDVWTGALPSLWVVYGVAERFPAADTQLGCVGGVGPGLDLRTGPFRPAGRGVVVVPEEAPHHGVDVEAFGQRPVGGEVLSGERAAQLEAFGRVFGEHRDLGHRSLSCGLRRECQLHQGLALELRRGAGDGKPLLQFAATLVGDAVAGAAAAAGAADDGCGETLGGKAFQVGVEVAAGTGPDRADAAADLADDRWALIATGRVAPGGAERRTLGADVTRIPLLGCG